MSMLSLNVGTLAKLCFDDVYINYISKYNLYPDHMIDNFIKYNEKIGVIVSYGVQQNLNLFKGLEEVEVYLVYMGDITLSVDAKYVTGVK